MKPTLDDLRRSAQFCGYEMVAQKEPILELRDVVLLMVDNLGTTANIEWNPPENAEQDRELRDALLKAGYMMRNITADRFQVEWPARWGGISSMIFDCHPNDFLTLAASKLMEVSNDKS